MIAGWSSNWAGYRFGFVSFYRTEVTRAHGMLRSEDFVGGEKTLDRILWRF